MSAAQLQGMFDASQFDPTQGAPQLPLGRHIVVITDSITRGTAANDGSGLIEFTVQIVDGPNKGQSGAFRLNLYNKNPKTVEIAHRQLSALCYVCGVMQLPGNCEPLHNRPFMIEVTPQQLTQEQLAAQAQGAAVTPYTQVTKFLYTDGREPGKEGQQAPGGAAQPQQAWGPGAGGGQAQQPQQPQGQPQQQWGAQGGQQPQQPQGGQPQQWGGAPQGGQPAFPQGGQQPQQPQQQWGGAPQGGQPQQPQGGNPAVSWGPAPAPVPATAPPQQPQQPQQWQQNPGAARGGPATWNR